MSTQNLQRGVTLVELVLALVVVGIFSVLYMTSTKEILLNVTTGKDLENGVYYAQACSDHIIATRRNAALGYAAIALSAPVGACTTICNGLPALPAGLTRCVIVSDGAADPLCLGGVCKKIEVRVQSGARTLADSWMFLIQ